MNPRTNSFIICRIMSIPYQLVPEYLDIGPGDILLEIGGNTGKITEAYLPTVKRLLYWSQNAILWSMEDRIDHILYLLKVMPLLLNNTN